MIQFKSFFRIFCVCFILLTSGLSLAAYGAQYSSIVVFGNSLSDNGNGNDYCRRHPWCSADIIFSNGKNTVEYLADYYGVSVDPVLNYSLQYLFVNPANYETSASAPAGTNYAFGGTLVPAENQVGRYLNDVSQQADPNALYVFFLGANYILWAHQDATGTNCSAAGCYADGLALLDTRAEETRVGIQRLIDAGATQFLVLNSDDIGSNGFFSPRTASTPQTEIVSEPLARDLSIRYSEILHGKITTFLNNAGVNVQWFDLFGTVEAIKNGQISHEIGNVVDPCIQGGNITSPCSESVMDDYFYFDEVHWTTAAHQVIASEILMQLEGEIQYLPLMNSITVVRDQGQINFHIVASDADGTIDAVQVEIGETHLDASSSDGLYWQTENIVLAPGEYFYTVSAFDNSGNVSSREDTFFVCIDASVDEHIQENRIYQVDTVTYFWWWAMTTTNYYLSGSDQLLGDGTSGEDRISLYPENNGDFQLCPESY